jgi:hypothetical protein
MRHRPPLLLVQPVQHIAFVEHAYEHNQAHPCKPVRRAGPNHPGGRVWGNGQAGTATLMAGNEIDPDGPAGPQPSRADKRWYFALMTLCIGMFVLSWAVLDRFSTLAAVMVSAVALVIPPFAVIVANVASATDRRRP